MPTSIRRAIRLLSCAALMSPLAACWEDVYVPSGPPPEVTCADDSAPLAGLPTCGDDSWSGDEEAVKARCRLGITAWYPECPCGADPPLGAWECIFDGSLPVSCALGWPQCEFFELTPRCYDVCQVYENEGLL